MKTISKTDLVFNTVSGFHWPFTASDVAKKLRWRQQDASGVLSYLAKRGKITLVAQVSSERSPIGYVNKYTLTRDEEEGCLSAYSDEQLLAELARRMK
jgi:ABC-type phosphate transport system substrate-binding protein